MGRRAKGGKVKATLIPRNHRISAPQSALLRLQALATPARGKQTWKLTARAPAATARGPRRPARSPPYGCQVQRTSRLGHFAAAPGGPWPGTEGRRPCPLPGTHHRHRHRQPRPSQLTLGEHLLLPATVFSQLILRTSHETDGSASPSDTGEAGGSSGNWPGHRGQGRGRRARSEAGLAAGGAAPLVLPRPSFPRRSVVSGDRKRWRQPRGNSRGPQQAAPASLGLLTGKTEGETAGDRLARPHAPHGREVCAHTRGGATAPTL